MCQASEPMLSKAVLFRGNSLSTVATMYSPKRDIFNYLIDVNCSAKL